MSNEYIDILQDDIIIPDIVQEKADAAFSKIMSKTNEENVITFNTNGYKKKRRFVNVKVASIILAMIFGGGSITALATAYMQLSSTMSKEMHISDEQMIELQKEEDSPLSFPKVSDTHDGITVSVEECMTGLDSFRIHVYVYGHEIVGGQIPEFEQFNVNVEGGRSSYSWSYENENPDDNRFEIYITGHVRFWEEDNIFDKEMTVRLDNIEGHEGMWLLKWKAEGTESVINAEPNVKLGDSGATVIGVEISPISVVTRYSFKREEIIVEYIDSKGNVIQETEISEPPVFVGVKLKDGTIITDLRGGGGGSDYDIDTEIHTDSTGLSKVLDIEEIESLLYLREVGEDGEITEENCYVVDIK